MRTVLITGANGNLGTVVVKALHAKGFGICATIGSGGIPEAFERLTLHTRQVNLTDENAVSQYAQEILRIHPELNAAILLVGGFAMGSIRETDGALLDKQIALNFKTGYFMVRSLIDHFATRGGGQFILIGSRPALQAEAGKNMVAYALSKSLVHHLAEIINAYGNGKKISATVIVPSTIDTVANRQSMPKADFSKWVKAEDIAETIAFILSDAGSSLRESILKLYNDA